jgi:hypothetical protein
MTKYINNGPNFTILDGPRKGKKYIRGEKYDESELPITNLAWFHPVEDPVADDPESEPVSTGGGFSWDFEKKEESEI